MNARLQSLRNNPQFNFLLLIIFGLIIIGINLITVMQIDREVDDIFLRDEELITLEGIQITLLEQEIAELEYLLKQDDRFLIRHREFAMLTRHHVENAQSFDIDLAERQIFDSIQQRIGLYTRNFEDILEATRLLKFDRAIELSIGVTDPLIQGIHHDISNFIEEIKHDLAQEAAEVSNLTRLSRNVSIFGLIGLFLLTVMVWRVSNRVMRPVLLLTVALSTASVLWNVFNITRLNMEVGDIVREIEEVAEIEEVEVALLEQELAEMEFLLTDDRSYLERHEMYRISAEEHLARADELASSEEELQLLAIVRTNQTRYTESFNEVIALVNSQRLEEAKEHALTESDFIVHETHQAIEKYVSHAQQIVITNLTEVDQITRAATIVSSLMMVLFAIVSVIVTTITGQVIAPVLRLIDAARAIEEEEYDMAMLNEVTERKDEIGRLAKVFQTMSSTVQTRTNTLKNQVQQLRIEIDEARSLKQVQEILDSDFFKGLEEGATKMRERRQRRRKST